MIFDDEDLFDGLEDDEFEDEEELEGDEFEAGNNNMFETEDDLFDSYDDYDDEDGF